MSTEHVWTKNPPQTPGFYWHRNPSGEVCMFHVFNVNEQLCCDGDELLPVSGGVCPFDPDSEWYGPVEPPR